MSETSIPTPTAEADLAPFLGLPAKNLAAIRHRHLTEDAHWKKNGRAIHYTEAGLQELAKHLQLAPAPPAGDPAAAAPPAAPAVTVALEITKARLRNPKIVLAKKSGAEAGADPPEIVRVRVRNNAKFRPGMILDPCEPLDAENGYWIFRGPTPRKPRFKW